MPVDREPADEGRMPAHYRQQLVEATEGTDLAVDGHKLRISNVPLFKHDPSGKLKQVVRVRVWSDESATPVTVRLRDEGRTIDEASIQPTALSQSAHLLHPEVEAGTAVTFEVVDGNGTESSVAFTVTPQRKWTVHLAHHSHYDIGYTDTQTEVMASQLAYIDSALELATVTDDWPEAARFRWNIEVNWPLQQWLRNRPQWARDELVRRIHEGRIEVNALPFSMHTEAYSFDELARQLDFTADLRNDLGIDVISAMQTDVPGATIGLSSLLTDAGIKYFVVAHNYAGRSIPHHLDGQELERPFYWQAPDGEKLLVWYTDTLYGIAYMEAMILGFGSGHDDVAGSLPEYLAAISQLGYPYGRTGEWLSGSTDGLAITRQPYPHDVLHLRVQGAFADNASTSLIPSQIVREWNDTWAYPRLRMSLNRDFFADVESRLADRLPVYEGDWTDWWADGIGSAAIELGKNRQSQADIRTAQTLHALSDHLTDVPLATIPDDVRRAYEDMALFDEHTWGAANPWERGAVGVDAGELQWTRKAGFALNAEERTRTLIDGGLRRISPLGTRTLRGDEIASLSVFNPSSFARTDLVRVFIPEGRIDTDAFDLVDPATAATVPYLVEPQDNAMFRPRGHWLRFLAQDIPPIGYARYVLRRSDREPGSPAPRPSATVSTTMANEHLTIDIDPANATIRSLVEQQSGSNLIPEQAPFGFNAYIYDRYASAPGFNHLSSRIGRDSGTWLLGSRKTAGYGHVIDHQSNDIWQQLTIRSSGDGADWLETRFTLPHGVNRLHIQNRLHKPTVMAKESVYYAFPVAGADPEFRFEITGGFVQPGDPHVPGSAHHFRAIRHSVTASATGQPGLAWATREAPLVQLGNIHIPYAPFPTTIPERHNHPGTIYSWALNNIWDTNFPPQQGGEMTFGYAVAASAKTDLALLGAQTGAAVSQPLVGAIAPLGAPIGNDLPDRGSFVSVDHPAVEVSHLAPSRDGKQLAIHLVSHASEPVETHLHVGHLPITSARIGTFLETDLQDVMSDDGTLTISIAPGQLAVVTLAMTQ